jgi:uncharacterized repeat protein (TIGR01451 family)
VSAPPASSRLLIVARLLSAAGLVALATPLAPPVRAQAALTLGLTANDTSLSPGETLALGISVDNPGGGPAADFYFLLLLPDGTTVVSTGPGVGVRFGTIANLRTLVPVARGISLAGAFPYAADPFFSYTFGGGEPVGTYRFFFVATRAGALGDGRLDGGDLLAAANQDVTFALGPSATVDTSRTTSAAVTPASGGTVQTTAANGTQLALAVPPGAVGVATTVSIAPLTGVSNLDAGPLVAGISAQPAGLKFPTAATLTVTLPAGFVAPPFGLRGFVFDDDGTDLQFVPVHLAGNVATMVVPHFSAAGVVVNDEWFRAGCTRAFQPTLEQLVACQRIFPLYQAEVQRLATSGGPLDLVFKFDVMAALQPWIVNGLIPRATAAQTPDSASPFGATSRLSDEWFSWLALRDIWGDHLSDRQNLVNGLVLGDRIDQFQDLYWRALQAAQQAGNAKCLADRANLDLYVLNVGALGAWWTLQGLPNLPWTQQFCADLSIEAAPPPVLVPPQSAPMPLSITLKFTDGIEVSATPARPVLVTITATNATVSPAGGAFTLPVLSPPNVAITPNAGATSSVVTITASTPGDALSYLPVRSRSFTAGTGQVNLPVTQSVMRAVVDMFLPGWSSYWRRVDASTAFLPVARVAIDQPSTPVTVAQGTFTGQNLSDASRGVASTGTQTVVTASGRLEPSLAIQPIQGFGPSQVAESIASVNQLVCFDLPGRHTVSFTQSSPPATGTFELRIDGALVQSAGAVTVDAGERCVHFVATVRCSNRVNWSTVGCDAPGGLAWSYSATLRPAP